MGRAAKEVGMRAENCLFQVSGQAATERGGNGCRARQGVSLHLLSWWALQLVISNLCWGVCARVSICSENQHSRKKQRYFFSDRSSPYWMSNLDVNSIRDDYSFSNWNTNFRVILHSALAEEKQITALISHFQKISEPPHIFCTIAKSQLSLKRACVQWSTPFSLAPYVFLAPFP